MFTELGDETFIIAAIMAMRYPRLVVYAGAMAALASMTVCTPCCRIALVGPDPDDMLEDTNRSCWQGRPHAFRWCETCHSLGAPVFS